MKTVTIFETQYPVIAVLSGGWCLIAHPKGPAFANESDDMLSIFRSSRVPLSVQVEGLDALRFWCISQPTWPQFEPDRSSESDNQNPGEVSTEAEPGNNSNKIKTS
jgi:hypothetical protein